VSDKSFYSFSSQLRWSDGTLGRYSATGVRQGDPLAGIFYNIGIHSAVESMNTRITALVAMRYPHERLPRKLVTFICDDGTLCVPSSLVNEAANICISIAEEFSLPLRLDKCLILSQVPHLNPIFTVEYNCAKILGVPLGFKYNNEDHPAIATRILLEKKIKLLSALRHIAPHSAFFILRYQSTGKLFVAIIRIRRISTVFLNCLQPTNTQIAHSNPLSPSNVQYAPALYTKAVPDKAEFDRGSFPAYGMQT
jgi:hypothetical protein